MSNDPCEPAYDVILSGAGPVGLFLACELAIAKCSVLVLEKAEHLRSPLKQLPFGLRGLNALSIEALYRRGLLEQLEVPRRLKDPADKSVTREHVQEVLRRISGTDVTLSALHTASTWTDRARQATTYRNGRVLLAGDAAHIHAPLGGQGLNLGLGDAMNLGWKLAATLHERAPKGLLETYETERHPIGAKVLDWSRAQAAMMKPDPGARALNALLRDLMETRDGVSYLAGRLWGVTTQYDLGAEHPLVGHSVPNFELGRRCTTWRVHARWLRSAARFRGQRFTQGHGERMRRSSEVRFRPGGRPTRVERGPDTSGRFCRLGLRQRAAGTIPQTSGRSLVCS